MEFQIWMLSYYLSAAFCYIESFYLYRSKNINRKILSYMVLSAGFWSLFDGLTQLASGEISITMQYAVLFISIFVAFTFLYFCYSFINPLDDKTLSLLLLIPVFLGLIFSLFVDVFVGSEERSFGNLRYIFIIYNENLYLLTVIVLLIPLIAGLIFLIAGLKHIEERYLKSRAVYFILGIIFAIASSYVLGTSEIIYHIPPVASIAISLGIGISSLSFRRI